MDRPRDGTRLEERCAGLPGPEAACQRAQRSEALVIAHPTTRGPALAPVGPASTNTGDGSAGFTARPAAAETYHVEREAALCAPGDGSDGDLLATALGIDTRVFS